VVRDQIGEVPISIDGLLGLVSNKPIEAHVPLFDPDDVPGVAGLIMSHFPRRPRDHA
jgi:molybdopterin-guanine dinucleotide biosynthesis protein B